MNLSNAELQHQRVEAYQTIEALTAELTRSVELSDMDTRALVGAAAVGSVLLEGQPGTGKTLIARSLATAMNGSFQRIQGAPDKQPGDIVGYEYWRDGAMVFQPGPALVANVLLADELNRNTEKTQAAFLEVMGEGQATVGTITHKALSPLTVIATQNPLEEPGTNELPRAELDRFALSMQTVQDVFAEDKILDRYLHSNYEAQPVVELFAVQSLRRAIKTVEISREMASKIMLVKENYANHPAVDKDYSILDGRAKLRMADLARYHALARGKGAANVTTEDVLFAAQYVLPHRVAITDEAIGKDYTHSYVIGQAFASASSSVN